MSDIVIVALIVLVGQMVTLFVTHRDQVATRASVAGVKDKVNVIEHHTNSMVELAVKQSRVIGHGEGVEQERDDQRERDSASSRDTP